MKTTKVYDIPTRLFHWLFAGLFIGATLITKTIDEESPLYAYHMLIGMTMLLIVILRVLWGIMGSRWARFSSFRLKPVELLQYVKDLLFSKTKRYVGHNPASSWATVVMFGLTVGLSATGYMMTQEVNRDFFKEIHEFCANAFIVVVIAHILGIFFHTFRHREAIGMSMIHGKKEVPTEAKSIQNTHFFAGVVFLCLVAAFVFYLYKNYDSQTQQLNLFNRTLQLGETEHTDHE